MLTDADLKEANGPVTLRSLVAAPTRPLPVGNELRRIVVDGVTVLAYSEAHALMTVRGYPRGSR